MEPFLIIRFVFFFFLTCGDLGEKFSDSFPACSFLFFFLRGDQILACEGKGLHTHTNTHTHMHTHTHEHTHLNTHSLSNTHTDTHT